MVSRNSCRFWGAGFGACAAPLPSASPVNETGRRALRDATLNEVFIELTT